RARRGDGVSVGHHGARRVGRRVRHPRDEDRRPLPAPEPADGDGGVVPDIPPRAGRGRGPGRGRPLRRGLPPPHVPLVRHRVTVLSAVALVPASVVAWAAGSDTTTFALAAVAMV